MKPVVAEVQQFLNAELGDGGDGDGLFTEFRFDKFDGGLAVFGSLMEIHLVESDDFGLFGQVGRIVLQFPANDMVVFDRISAIDRLDIHDVDENSCALDMSEELVTEACSGGGALDKAGDIRDDHGAMVGEFGDAELRLECREGVVGNLRMSGGQGGEKRGLARIGFANETYVGDEFEFEANAEFVAWLTASELARCLVGGGLEMFVSVPALTTFRSEDGFVDLIQVGDQIASLIVVDERAGGDANGHIIARLAELTLAASGLAAMSAPVVLTGHVEKRVDVRRGFEVDVAASTTVSSIRTSFGDVGFASEGKSTVASLPREDFDDGLIDEHGDGGAGNSSVGY